MVQPKVGGNLLTHFGLIVPEEEDRAPGRSKSCDAPVLPNPPPLPPPPRGQRFNDINDIFLLDIMDFKKMVYLI